MAGSGEDAAEASAGAAVPVIANAVCVTGGADGTFTNITGAGAAALLWTTNNVLRWGTLAVTDGTRTAALGVEFLHAASSAATVSSPAAHVRGSGTGTISPSFIGANPAVPRKVVPLSL